MPESVECKLCSLPTENSNGVCDVCAYVSILEAEDEASEVNDGLPDKRSYRIE